MSQGNVELVREAFRHFEAEDFEAIEHLWDPDGLMTSPEGWPEKGPFEGRGAIIGQFRRLASDWESHGFREVEIVADREDWVVLSFQWEVQGAGSGAPVATRITAAYHFTDGRFDVAHFRWTTEEALQAAGLEPSTRR